jgi:hypothetical protein
MMTTYRIDFYDAEPPQNGVWRKNSWGGATSGRPKIDNLFRGILERLVR